jgi:hypothetical protein
MRSLAYIGVALLVLFAASGCVSLAEGTAQAPEAPTATPLPPTPDSESSPSPEPTAEPTMSINPDLQRIFFTYQHTTNVFSVSLPETWTARDDSTEDRLVVVLEPPLGFASQVMIDIIYESGLTLNELASLRDGYLGQVYGSDANYNEINQADLPDGRLQATYLYSNPAGASGRETVYLSQSGPYFAALRAFTSDQEAAALSDVMEQIAESFTLNPTARWGEPEVEINLEELQVQGLNGWYDSSGNYRVAGRIHNNWVEDVGFLAVSAGVCDPNGVVLGESSVLLVNDLLPQGGVVPFEVRFGPIDHEDPRPCLVQPRAEPASNLELAPYTALDVTHTASLGEEEDDPVLLISGTVLNTGTEFVHLIDVLIAVYNGLDGEVVGYTVTTTDAAELGPGQASLFTYGFTAGELGADPATAPNWAYELWVQVNPLPPTPES